MSYGGWKDFTFVIPERGASVSEGDPQCMQLAVSAFRRLSQDDPRALADGSLLVDALALAAAGKRLYNCRTAQEWEMLKRLWDMGK